MVLEWFIAYSHFPGKDPTWSLNVHSSNGCQAMNLSWKHNSHFFPRLRFDSFHCLNLETWSDGNWRKHGHCRRHRPPQTTILENSISRFQTWKFPFHQPLLRIQAFLGVPLPISMQEFLQMGSLFCTTRANANLSKLWLRPKATDSRCRKSWFVAPPQGAVCSTAWSRRVLVHLNISTFLEDCQVGVAPYNCNRDTTIMVDF